VSRVWQARQMRRALVPVVGTVVVLAACSGGGSSATGTTVAVATAAKQQAALQAARACRMWTETATAALKIEPMSAAQAAPYDAKSATIAAAANAASNADPAWNNLATDVAGANDFASVALPDINTRITKDCKAVPSSARAQVAGEPDPFATTSTSPP